MIRIDNHYISEILKEIAMMLVMKNDFFRARSYEKAAEELGGMSEEVSGIYEKGGIKALEEIPGIGVSIGEKIEELLRTSHLKFYEILKKELPINLGELSLVSGLGPKGIKKLYEKFKIKDLKTLRAAAERGKISTLEGFGEKSEQNILKSIEFLERSKGRIILGYSMPKIREIEKYLRGINGVVNAVAAGSVRRRKETIGDVDILVSIKNKNVAVDVIDAFLKIEGVARKISAGETKASVVLENGLQIDLRVVSEASYGAALNYFTGSKEHNIALREIANKKGWKLNEYGLFKVKSKMKHGEDGKLRRPAQAEVGAPTSDNINRASGLIAGRTEEEIYEKLGMNYIEPEMREMNGEIERAITHRLPSLIGYCDLQGDLQVQSNWTDGDNSIEELARAAIKKGLKYIAITDHTKRLAMVRGLDEARIKKQWTEIDAVNKKLAIEGIKFKILKGTECDILKDGSLDLPDDVLSKLDVVGVAVHSLFNLSEKDQTNRIKRAMENLYVDIVFHPTGRVINRREAYAVNVDDLIEAAKKTGTILEVDAFPDRLDLNDEYIRKGIAEGIKFSIDSDAHSISHFDYLEFGVAQARRGWAERNDIINAQPLMDMLKFLKKAKK